MTRAHPVCKIEMKERDTTKTLSLWELGVGGDWYQLGASYYPFAKKSKNRGNGTKESRC